MSRGEIRGYVRRRRLPGLIIGLLLAAVALCPAGASARSPGHYIAPSHRAIRFQVQGSHSYVIEVAEGSRRHFSVTVRGGHATVEYQVKAPQPQPRSGVRGKVGHLGSFNVDFTPRGQPRQLPRYPWCTGPGPTIQPGTVRGTIRFRGESDYTSALAHRASAELEAFPSQRCHYGETGQSEHPPRYTATLSADHETGGPGTHFEALRFAPNSRPAASRVYYSASAYEQLGPVRVIRQIHISSPTSTFLLPHFATAPENAVIHPPTPFTGTATFGRTPQSTFTWAGDLAVAFPGIDPLPLVGPDFRLEYCALRTCINQEPPS